MPRVGITGLTGMIGRNFLDYFRRAPREAAGLEVVALSRQAQAPSFLEGIPCRRIDFSDPASFAGALEDLEAVVPRAGLPHAADPRAFFRANRDGTAAVVEAVRRYGKKVRHLLYASSQTTVGPVPAGQEATDELTPCRPVSHYGASKLAAELAVRQAPVPWTILRLPAVWGRYDPDGLAILKTARSGLLPLLGGQESVLSYIFAQDLAPLLPRILLNERLYFGIYNLGYDEPVPLGEYCLAVRRLLGLTPRLVRVPLPRWIGFAAMAALAVSSRLSGGRSAATPDKVREFMATRWVQSNLQLKKALGLPALRESGALADTVSWFRGQGLL
jgi:nucleoside-diphosphate-sugar epimerase